MAGEPNQTLWRGIRPTDPAENIPVDVKVQTANVPIIPSTPAQNIPVDVKSYVVNAAQGVASEGQLYIPVANVLLADTGQLVAGYYDFTVLFNANAPDPGLSELQYRNSGNTSNTGAQIISVGIYPPVCISINKWEIATNERLRVISLGGLIGYVCVSIWWTKYA